MGYYKNISAAGGRSNTPVSIEFSGEEELLEVFKKLPVKWGKKPVVATFRKGSNKYKKQVKQNFPDEIRSLIKALSTKAGKGNSISLRVGIFGKKGMVTLKDGREYDVFFPIYWNNYGTLSKRDGSHEFKFSRKPKTNSWAGGIYAQKFMEKSWEQSKNDVENTINTELKTQTIKFLNKHKVA